jgi:hypothetical protein
MFIPPMKDYDLKDRDNYTSRNKFYTVNDIDEYNIDDSVNDNIKDNIKDKNYNTSRMRLNLSYAFNLISYLTPEQRYGACGVSPHNYNILIIYEIDSCVYYFYYYIKNCIYLFWIESCLLSQFEFDWL